ncbi:sporulation histidine kinase inhibitor Sda [Halobacillus fulvus]|nr:sporulation histidine kinase inhibitor Sda [Halobacillus fulvus]
MHHLNLQLLILSLHRAQELKLDREFIRLLEEEIMKREEENKSPKQKMQC